MPLAPVLPPPLRDGDCLTADEFLRRWESMPEIKHAELIDGVVYMPSPVLPPHAQYETLLTWLLTTYRVSTPGCESVCEATWLMGEGQVPQPDCTLRILPEHGGRSRIEKYYTGAPEFIVEVTKSRRSPDLGAKLRLYERIGVREYLVVLTSEAKLIWHDWTAGGFERREADPDGIFRSRTFPGLWLDAEAILRLDYSQISKVLQEGLASSAHAEFVARLNPGT